MIEQLQAMREKAQSDREARIEKRKLAVKRVQYEAPDLALFLTEFNRVFGRPAHTQVWINWEKVI